MHVFSLVSPVLFIAIIAILGFVTPGYSHMNHTISRLAIMKYSWIQTLNFLQLAAGFVLISKNIARSMQKEESRRIIRIFFAFSASILVLATVVPTDPIDNIPFRFTLLTPTGSLHIATVLIFLLLSPACILHIVRALRTEPDYRRFAPFTTTVGTIAFFTSVIWLAFFYLGIFLEYRGIFQKGIVLLIILWITILHLRSIALTRTKPT